MVEHIVKSFNLDHRKVVAPFIRVADRIVLPKGDVIIKLDIRFTNPNKEFMDVPSVHTLEHLLATYLREDGLGVLDFSPMGCQTGFYLSLFEEIDLNEFKKRLIKSLGRVLETTHIPGATEIECGNYKSHSLDGAKNIVKKFLSSNVLIMENDYV